MISTVRRSAIGPSLVALLASVGCQPSASSEQPNSTSAPVVTAPVVTAERTPRAAEPETAPLENAQSDSSVNAKSDSRTSRRAERFSMRPQEDTKRVRPRLAIRAGGKRDITFDDLEFEIERDADFQRSLLTKEIEDLNGRSLVIRGFILASSVLQQSGIQQFVLVRDNQECCFGPGAYLFHNIRIQMAEGKTTSFRVRPVSVEGKFTIEPWIGVDGKCYSVYYMTADRVW